MIVIPMAGESSRFRKAGYDRPKYMLELAGRPLFDWTVLSFQAQFLEERFLFVARDVDGTSAFIRERLHVLGIRQSETVLLDGPTSGQAETVAFGLAQVSAPDCDTLTVFNIDTIRPLYAPPLDPKIQGAAGWLEVFEGAGEGWSFIEPAEDGSCFVRRTTEKLRISNLCCTGLYAFRSPALFGAALAAERARPSSPELYVAPIYNHLIAQKLQVAFYRVPADQVLFSGVPAEYEALRLDAVALAGRF